MTETEDTVTMSRAEYEALVDARDHAIAMWKIALGDMPMLPDEEMDAYLGVQSVPFIGVEVDD
jgi:hypothetical protein